MNLALCSRQMIIIEVFWADRWHRGPDLIISLTALQSRSLTGSEMACGCDLVS